MQGAEKSSSQPHACRDGVWDEFGIGFSNPAVIEVSQPVITAEAPHQSDKKSKCKVTYVWAQYMLVDADQITYADPAQLGDWDKIPSS